MHTIHKMLMLFVWLICHSAYAGVIQYYGGTLADCIEEQSDDMSDKKKKALCKAKQLRSLNVGKGTNESYCISHAKNAAGKCNSVDSASAGGSATLPPQMPATPPKRWVASDVEKIIPTGSFGSGKVNGGVGADDGQYKVYRSGNNVYIREKSSDGNWVHRCVFNSRLNSACKKDITYSSCQHPRLVGDACTHSARVTFSPTPAGLLVSSDANNYVCIKSYLHFCTQWITVSKTDTRNHIWDH